MSDAQVDLNWLCDWLEENSSGVYRPAKDAAYVIRDLRQKLEAAEADLLRANLQLITLKPKLESCEAALAERDKVIREAREQKPVATLRFTHGGYSAVLATHVMYGLPEGTHDVYAYSVPAMPIQDDNWVTITNEEWNIPKIGQRVIVCIDGVVQNVPVKIDCTDPDIGCCKYYWDHKDFDESPFVKAGDSWMPWPTKPQPEVKPS